MSTDRRTFLKAGAALLASGAAGVAHSQGSLQSNTDTLLQSATDAGDVPGVVAVAIDRLSVDVFEDQIRLSRRRHAGIDEARDMRV